jgi:putative FmdB family regulatory protein
LPTYVYECKKCGKVIEAEQRITESPLKDCGCGGRGTLNRVIQPTAVMFKGGGFHINDYAPKAPCSDDCACNPPQEED